MRRYRVLILEDQAFQRGLLANLFAAEPRLTVDTSGSAAHAAAMCQLSRYDLVVSDLLLPGMDGIQFIQALAAQQHSPMLALASSAPQRMMSSAKLMAESLDIKVLAVLAKPVGPLDVQRVVERMIASCDDPANAQQQNAKPVAASAKRLRQAIDANEITAWFQPKKSLVTGLVVAAEALARWRHPELGTLLPSQFLPLMQEHALDAELVRHILRQSVHAQLRWRDAGFRIPISINLPPHLLEQRDLPDELLAITELHGGIAADICFELMESSTTGHVSDYYAGACRLRMKGFGLAQDDFGQGLSSVYKLLNTPFTEVKIDRALVSGCALDPALHSAVATVIALGTKLGLKIVAEGVETDADLAALRKMGCDQVQGFLISNAVPPDAFATLLRREKTAHVHCADHPFRPAMPPHPTAATVTAHGETCTTGNKVKE